MNAEPYLCLAGTEIVNANRTLAYLDAGLAGSQFFVHPGACYCPVLDESEPFSTPAADEAPWYESSRAESGEFFGVITDVLRVENPPVRSVSTQAHGGRVGTLTHRPRLIVVHGYMYASSARGMDWGERWLTEALSGGSCDTCGGDDAEILPACPDSPGILFDIPVRQLLDVGIVDGPIFTPMADIPGCLMQEVAFQLVAGNPYLHHSLNTASTTVFAGQTFSYALQTQEWGGDMGVAVTLEALSNLTDVVVRAAPLTDIDDCGDLDLNPCVEYRIASVPEGHILSIDGRRRSVTEFNDSSKVWESGYRRLAFDGPFDWIEVPPCSLMCVTVTVGGGTADVEVGWALREI